MKSPAQRKADERARKAKLGLRRLELWAKPGDHKAIHQFNKELMEKRGREKK